MVVHCVLVLDTRKAAFYVIVTPANTSAPPILTVRARKLRLGREADVPGVKLLATAPSCSLQLLQAEGLSGILTPTDLLFKLGNNWSRTASISVGFAICSHLIKPHRNRVEKVFVMLHGRDTESQWVEQAALQGLVVQWEMQAQVTNITT